MRKILLPFITVLMLALFLGACNSEDVMPEIGSETNPELTERTISFTASMPGEDDPATRVSAAEEADRGITLTWDENDKLDLLFVQGENKFHESTTVTNIENGGKNATFTVPLPDGITDGTPYNLYGVYGGGAVSTTNPALIGLPAIEEEALNEENVGKKVMLRFAKENLNLTDAVGAVNFEHVGFLFTAKIKVTAGSVNDITSVQLVGATDVNGTWAYNASENHFDMEAGTFTAEGTGSNTVSFQNSEKDVTKKILTVRNWQPAIGTAWPALKLSVNGTESADTKPARTLEVGRAYYLYAQYDGTKLVFADKEFTVPAEKGTKENPYTVAEAFGKQDGSTGWVKGYIIGYKKSSGYSVGFTTEGASGTNIAIADNKDEAVGNKALGVQLTNNKPARTDLNLASNPEMYKVQVLLLGTLEPYFTPDEGLKNVEEYVIIPDGPFFESTTTAITLKADAGSTGTIDLSTSEAWTATSSETWLTVSPASGTGISDIIVTAEANTVTSTRTATVTLTPTGSATGLTPIDVTVTQDAFVPSIAVDPASLTFAKEGGSETIAVTANVDWTATSDAAWLTLTSTEGVITVAAEANSGAEVRNGTITITGDGITETVAVTQAGAVAAFATDLFFSEYVHGSGVNKYLEIYNGTGADVNLSDYVVKAYMNGASTASNTLNLTGTIADGEVIIISDPGASSYTGTVHFKSNVAQFNGNDAIALMKGAAYIDIIGHIGQDKNWKVNEITTEKKTLVRKSDVKEGVSSSTTDFPELGTQWNQYNQNTYSYLGSHTTDY